MNLILHNRGNYKELLTFKKATVIFDLTYHFCQKYLSKGDRTVDQMIQAARSGKQNIAEGVAASSTNAETEIKLVNVAKASLKELLTDFEDYLRTRSLRQWDKEGKEITWMRDFAKNHLDPAPYLAIAEQKSDKVVANMAIVLLKQEDYLLHRQLAAIEKQFKESGDLHGRMKQAMSYGVKCPRCGKLMSNGTTSSNGVLEYKWSCFNCKVDVKTDGLSMTEVTRERGRRIMAVKRIYGY
jgi:four helix bundle suffix protein